MRKPKTPQKKNVNEISGRDLFQTPNYATELLIPFIPKDVSVIWECAAGLGKIVKVLLSHGYGVAATDLQQGINFLVDDYPEFYECIITNTPFSLKEEFYLQCRKYDLPFALLIPADYSGWIIKAVQDGAEKIIPTRRVDYITPNILQKIWEGETWKVIKKELDLDSPLITAEMYADSYPMEWQHSLAENKQFKFDSIYDTPAKFLRKYSSSQFHSMWLTWGFNLGQTETFVELTNEMKDNI